MAETIVNLVLEKITDVLVKEVLRVCGVEEQVEKIERELNWIKAFLKDADRKQITDEVHKEWVSEVREIAYCIEDVIDTFLCEIPQKKQGKMEAIKRMFHKTKRIGVIRNLVDEINRIMARLQEINDKKVRFGITSLGDVGGGGKMLPIRPPVLPDIEDPDVVGLNAEKEIIIKELLDESTPRRSVVSIVGPGGLGKTTLAKKVYNSSEVQRTFDIRLWVVISQQFELINVLKKIRGELRQIDKSEQEKDGEYFLMDIFHSLKGKKYLLILDDVWSTNLWMSIEKALPNENNGSRILMTSRISEVAKEADTAREPYNLRFLTEQPSLELFLKNALRNREIQNECPNDLLDLAKQFVHKCGGLPLALVVLGGLLAKKQPTYSAWSKVLRTMYWYTNEQKVCMEIIGTSYEDLTLALKSCFMYFAAFLEDYDIDVPSLLRMWIAEGFIPYEENRTLEDTAESFLEDLVQRSMIQVSERSLHNDSIQTCRIHDLLHDVAIQKAKEDKFLVVCATPDGVQGCCQTRRIAVHNLTGNKLTKFENPNLRTLLCFNSYIPDCSGHRLLKVLSNKNRSFQTPTSDPPNMKHLEGLSQLRYLELNRRSIMWNQRSLEKLIGCLKFLQTLDFQSFDIGALPDCIWKIKTMRHVLLDYYSTYMLGPPPTTNLTNLQTLHGVKCLESWKYNNIPNLPNLIALGIEITQGVPCSEVAAFLQTLKKLVNLSIKGQDILTEIVDMRGFPFYQYLTGLSYEGTLSCHGFDVAMFPIHLAVLSLSDSELQQDHIAVLEKLHGLKQLELFNAYPNQIMRCSAGGFPKLQIMYIALLDKLEQWEIEDGALPVLNEMTIECCSMLQVPQGLQYLTALAKIRWNFYGDDSGPLKAEEIRRLCKHMPSISFYSLNEDSV